MWNVSRFETIGLITITIYKTTCGGVLILVDFLKNNFQKCFLDFVIRLIVPSRKACHIKSGL